MSSSDTIRFYAATDVGRVRGHNEDNFLVDKKLGLFVVCDGMGGHAAGEIASAIAVRTLHEELKAMRDDLNRYASEGTAGSGLTPKGILTRLEHAVQAACLNIHLEAQSDPQKRGMGTTLSAILVIGHQGFVAHVGDSRIYLMRAGKTEQITEDHTVYNELIKRGRLSREQIEKVAHKNAITRAVGVYERVEVDCFALEVLPGDVFLLASDGLAGYLESPDELTDFLRLEGEASATSLIALANDRGGKDNITTIVVKYGRESASDDTRAQRVRLKRDLLSRMPLFARLDDREVLRVMQLAQVRAYSADQRVIREGDKGDELFIVLTGQVQVVRDESVITVLGPGQHFGEMALIRNVPRSATVIALGKAELITIRRADFFEILRKDHEIAVKMLWQFLGVLAERLDQTNSELRNARAELAGEEVTIDLFPEGDREVDLFLQATDDQSARR